MVLCVDEKSQVQALERTAPILPLRPGLPEKADPRLHPPRHDHAVRRPRSRHRPGARRLLRPAPPPGVPEFLKQVAKAYPRRKLHLVVDNYATHKHPAVRAWLARNPRVTLHFTPTSGSWLNLVEVFFSIITRQAIRRGSYRSVDDLTEAIRTYIDGWNTRCRPFVWTKPADELVARATGGQRTSITGLVGLLRMAGSLCLLGREGRPVVAGIILRRHLG